MLDGLEILGSLVTGLVNVELRSTVLHSLLTLVLGAGEDNYVVAHGSSQLDSEMAQATDSDNAYGLVGLEAVLVKACPDRRSSAEPATISIEFWSRFQDRTYRGAALAESYPSGIWQTVLESQTAP